MAELIGLAASAAGGGVFGLLGTVIGRAAGYFEQRQSQAHERARWQHEAHLAGLELQARREESEAAERLAETSGRWQGLAASMQAEASIGESYAWVNAVRALTRPVLTLLLWLITWLVFLASPETEQAKIVETATFAATAATLWWFGDRGAQRNAR
ncbi:MAG: hypothetical protein CME99_12895 [Hyphomonas sp.]|uniref:hypothetical protein n=1 Tax=Hyphomonas TaxID=85 RepID=UPI000B73F963|nr:hypothetical protein [Hyphomonas sp.]MAH94060.1 hypothetical protein [Hyphomonas sp.]OUX83308.1 MAG: hypothetical protein CBB91_12715 [Hyphomonas sp. TMED31]HBH44833.1 hypothetical protein [Hyphomonas atlantica]